MTLCGRDGDVGPVRPGGHLVFETRDPAYRAWQECNRATLCFRERDEEEAELLAHGYTVDDIRGAPDRPDQEFVLVASRPE